MKKTILALAFLLVTITPAIALPSCGTLVARKIVFIVLPYVGEVTAVEVTTTTCCWDAVNQTMSCTAVVTYEF